MMQNIRGMTENKKQRHDVLLLLRAQYIRHVYVKTWLEIPICADDVKKGGL